MAEAAGADEVPATTELTFPSDLKFEIDGYQHTRHCTVEEYEADQAGDKTACKGMMTTQPSGGINIRGANYLNDKVKIPHVTPVFRLLCVWNFTYKEAIQNITSRLTCVKEFFAKHPDREFFVNNRMIPTTPWQMTVEIYERPMSSKSTPAFEKLWAKYKAGDDEYRNERFKFIMCIPNAGWMLRGAISALGGFRPVILGRKYLKQYHYQGSNWYENDLDIGSSKVARAIVGTIIPKLEGIITDEAYVIEGKDEDDLPEVVLAQLRGCYMSLVPHTVPVEDSMFVEGLLESDGKGVSLVDVALREAAEATAEAAEAAEAASAAGGDGGSTALPSTGGGGSTKKKKKNKKKK